MFLLVLQIAITSFLTGLIWITQRITYPGFQWVEPNRSLDYFAAYQNRISWIVVPLMLTEVIVAAFLLWTKSLPLEASLFNLLTIVCIWGFTFFESVKRHQSLLKEYDQKVIKRLVKGNWVRTFLWTTRVLFLLIIYYMLV